MKKLAFAAAALAAGVAMADGSIQSANVVGYQQKKLAGGENSFITMTLMPVGTAKSDVKLSDFVPTGGATGFAYDGSDYLSTLKVNGCNDKSYGYLSEYWRDKYFSGCTTGWYDQSVCENEEFADNEPVGDTTKIPFSTCVVVYTASASATVTFAGEVLSDDYGIPLNGGANTFTGIVAPADMYLADLEPTVGKDGFAYDGSDYLSTLKVNGCNDKYYGYLSEYWRDLYFKGCAIGWYDASVCENEEFADNEPYGKEDDDPKFSAGQGLVIYTAKPNIELVVPSALP